MLLTFYARGFIFMLYYKLRVYRLKAINAEGQATERVFFKYVSLFLLEIET